MAAKNKALEPEETVAQDNHATEDAQDNHATEDAQDNHATEDAQDNHATEDAQDNHATVVAQAERKSVVFLGPHSRYSRGDIAWFEGSHAEELVKRRIAVWPKDAERALKPKPGDSDFDTDIG
ncbi:MULTISPECIES: hypothetical protein [Klebsiella]|uniref:hypothetical protein n=1 Tax=Klebsiella TaxID=570 RepID=UPI001166C55E|nr:MULTISPECIES: hypothetical protein [Klebsiella]VUS88145.1 hypothetical protein SB6416_05563 [Klebsiella pasteurii]